MCNCLSFNLDAAATYSLSRCDFAYRSVCHVQSHAKLCSDVSALAERVQSDSELSAQIRRKYTMKNTVGYR